MPTNQDGLQMPGILNRGNGVSSSNRMAAEFHVREAAFVENQLIFQILTNYAKINAINSKFNGKIAKNCINFMPKRIERKNQNNFFYRKFFSTFWLYTVYK